MKNPCLKCKNKCCNYILTQIQQPRTKREIDEARWMLLHENVHIFQDRNAWYVMFLTPCVKLKDGLCTIYNEKPKICSDYPPEGYTCKGVEKKSNYKVYLKTPEDLDKWRNRESRKIR